MSWLHKEHALSWATPTANTNEFWKSHCLHQGQHGQPSNKYLITQKYQGLSLGSAPSELCWESFFCFLFFFKNVLFLVMSLCGYVLMSASALSWQKRVSDPPKARVRAWMWMMGAGYWTGVFHKSRTWSKFLSHLSTHLSFYTTEKLAFLRVWPRSKRPCNN